MKIQGSGSALHLPREVGDASQVQGLPTGTQPQQTPITPENYLDKFEGVKAGQAGSLAPSVQLPELSFDKLSDLKNEVQQKLQETHRGKRGGGKKGVADDDEDADGDGIPDNQQ
ncbi:MAG: hypothetical protein ABIJ09_04880 [Pseudomonadota bacterium]